jgi:hypothetical protein
MITGAVRMPLFNIGFYCRPVGVDRFYLCTEGDMCDLMKKEELNYLTHPARVAELIAVSSSRATLRTVVSIVLA